MERAYPVFVPPTSINEIEMEHSDVLTWCYENLKPGNINSLYLDLDDIYLIQYHSLILDIINEENGGMLQVGEDDWIIETGVKRRIYERLRLYETLVFDERIKVILKTLLQLLEISIKTNRNIYFIF